MDDNFSKGFKRAADRIGELIKDTAVNLAPKDTGDLEKSIKYKVEATGEDEYTITVYTELVDAETGYPYPAKQEGEIGGLQTGTPEKPFKYVSGGGKIASRPFLAAANFLSQPQFNKIITEELNGNN